MESRRFDRLATVLASRQPRRATLALLALFGLGLPERSQADRTRTVRRRKCIPADTSCGLKKGTHPHHPCQKCCEAVRKETPKKGRCCTPSGGDCFASIQCCLGVCFAGLCQNEVIQHPPPGDVGDVNSSPPPTT